MSATSSRTRATAAFHTFIISAIAASGVLAMLSSMIQCAWLAKPSSLARSARSARISVMTGLLSCAPALSPRLTHIRQTFSRRSRRVE